MDILILGHPKKHLIVSRDNTGKGTVEHYSTDLNEFHKKRDELIKKVDFLESFGRKQNENEEEKVFLQKDGTSKMYNVDLGSTLSVYYKGKLIGVYLDNHDITLYTIGEKLFVDYYDALNFAKKNEIEVTSKKVLIIIVKRNRKSPTYEVWVNREFSKDFSNKEDALSFATKIDTTDELINFTVRGRWDVYVNKELVTTITIKSEVIRYLNMLEKRLNVSDEILVKEVLIERQGVIKEENKSRMDDIPLYINPYK